MSIDALITQQQTIKKAHRQNYKLLREVGGKESEVGIINKVMASMDVFQGHLMQLEKVIYHLEYRERKVARKSPSGHKTSRH